MNISSPSIPCLIGQVFVDFVQGRNPEPMMRLGGIMHAARALWSMGTRFGFGYIAPDYLKEDTESFARQYGALTACQLGTISRCPNVVLVGEGREVGAQRYEYLLRAQSICHLHSEALKKFVLDTEFSDFIIFPGGFQFKEVLKELTAVKGNVFADINFIPGTLQDLSALGRKFTSLILSTSSDLFSTTLLGEPAKMSADLQSYTKSILLKENRGGSRLFTSTVNEWISAPAQVRSVLHSVGVGDFFDAIFVVQRQLHNDAIALAYASIAAAEYASYYQDSDIQESVAAVLAIGPEDVQNIGGVTLPWESRRKINVYLAAPDFDYVETTPLNTLAEAIAYHNFSPRRPVREHGQARSDSSPAEKRRLAEADLDLLANCDLLIAVLLYDDPGTLIEIGIAIDKQIPVIVFDPFKRANNLILTELPILVSSDIDAIIREVFVQAGKICK